MFSVFASCIGNQYGVDDGSLPEPSFDLSIAVTHICRRCVPYVPACALP